MISEGVRVQYERHASFLRRIFSVNSKENTAYINSMEHKLGDRSMGIYIVYNKITGDYYIVSSLDIHKRRVIHTRTMQSDKWKSGNQLLRKHSKKYGIDAFIFLKLHCVVESNLSEVEEFWIKELDPFYNISKRSIRYIVGDKQRESISNYSKNRRDNSIYKVAVIQYDMNMNVIKEWSSLKEIGETLKVSNGNITHACRNTKKDGSKPKVLGCYWEYKNGMTTPKPRYA